MTEPAGGDAPQPSLSDGERARLRPTVDVDALERFIAAIPNEDRPGVRRAAVLHFSQHVTVKDVHDFLTAIGNEEAAAEMDRTLAALETEPLPEPEIHPAREPGHVSHVSVPTNQQLFQMERPEGPHLRALWDAIEPPLAGSG